MTALLPRIVAIVPAAGIGSRMQADKPKQYLSLCGKTILEHSLQCLLDYPAIKQIIVAVAKEDAYIDQLDIIKQKKITLVEGGKNRSDSVLAGLNAIQTDKLSQTWVLVHDAARPCLRHTELDKLLAIQNENGAILALPAIDTIKRATPQQQIENTEDRDYIWLAQTPQYFRADILKKALTQALAQQCQITDEASAMEFLGFRPHLVEGRSDNIKITRPEDLPLAEFYLTRK